MFFHGIRIIPSELTFLSGWSRFSEGGGGGVKHYFIEVFRFFFGKIHC